MAIDQLTVDPSKPLGSKIRQLIETTQRAQNLANEISGDMDHLVADPDYSGVATATTLQDIDGVAGDGQVLYNLINGAKTNLNTTDVNSLLNRISWR